MKTLIKIMEHPATVMTGISAGFAIGVYWSEMAALLAPIGKMYLAFLNMCILPIIMTAVISGLAHIIRTPEISKQFPRILSRFAMLLFVPSVLGVVAAVLGRPGQGLSGDDLESLGGMLAESPKDAVAGESSFVDFIVGIVPWNLFDSVSRGETVSVVFACIFIGIGAGMISRKSSDLVIETIDAFSAVFNLMFKWALYFLPIGILCVIADQMSGVSLSVFSVMFEYIVIAYAAMIFLIFVYLLIMWRTVGGSLGRSLLAMKDPLFLAFTVNSSFIAVKSSIDGLVNKLGVDEKIASLLVPFMMVANRQGKIFIFAFTTLFLAQLYGVELDMSQYLVVVIGSALAGMAAPGGGPMLVPSIAVVLAAIGIPIPLAFVIFTINGPIVDRILSALTVQASCLLAASASEPSAGLRERGQHA